MGLVDPVTGMWSLRDDSGAVTSFFYGNPGDKPFMGDWDGDGVDTPGLYRQSDGFVYLRNSNTQGVADIRFFFGNPGDVPLAGDFDGDGYDTVSIYRPSEARIYVINELGANDGGLGEADFSYIFGNPGDKPFVGDFNGDGLDTIGLHRETTGFVYFRQTNTQGIADAEFFFGNPDDRLVAGDWGVIDTVDTPAVFRPSDAAFYFRYTNTQGIADGSFVFGSRIICRSPASGPTSRQSAIVTKGGGLSPPPFSLCQPIAASAASRVGKSSRREMWSSATVISWNHSKSQAGCRRAAMALSPTTSRSSNSTSGLTPLNDRSSSTISSGVAQSMGGSAAT